MAVRYTISHILLLTLAAALFFGWLAIDAYSAALTLYWSLVAVASIWCLYCLQHYPKATVKRTVCVFLLQLGLVFAGVAVVIVFDNYFLFWIYWPLYAVESLRGAGGYFSIDFRPFFLGFFAYTLVLTAVWLWAARPKPEPPYAVPLDEATDEEG